MTHDEAKRVALADYLNYQRPRSRADAEALYGAVERIADEADEQRALAQKNADAAIATYKLLNECRAALARAHAVLDSIEVMGRDAAGRVGLAVDEAAWQAWQQGEGKT